MDHRERTTRGSAGDLPVALRAEKRAISARRLSKPPTPANDLFQEETDDPLVADRRNFSEQYWVA